MPTDAVQAAAEATWTRAFAGKNVIASHLFVEAIASDPGFRAAVEQVNEHAEHDDCPSCRHALALLTGQEQKT